VKRFLVDLCVLAYPRALRKSDRDYLSDLALELAQDHGLTRQLASLIRNGIGERITEWREASSRRRAWWTRRAIVGSGAAALMAIAVTGALEPAAGLGEQFEVEAEVEQYASGQVPKASGSIARFVDRTLPPGASGTLVAAGDGEFECLAFGLANREQSVPARCNTAYDVMSMTKQFTAAAILKLEMMGKLEVSDPISDYIANVPADKRQITLHHLLTHTSGLVSALGDDYERLTRRRMLATALASELRSQPGVRYHYSNVGYSILAAIVEKVSGVGYEEFLAEHLFRPAGMTHTGYVLPDWRRRQVAVEYDPRGKPQGRPFDHPWADDGPYWNLRGNGGILSTARDMFRWHRALEGDAVLDRASKEELFEPYVLEEPGGDTHYGYGWVIADEAGLGRVAWHDGGNGWSFGVVARLLDEEAMVFWVTNRYRNPREGWNIAGLGERLTRGVLERVVE
jgi:CubicO group peptidase (beta-lactamase class C family)